MLIKTKHEGYWADGRRLYPGGGKGGSSAPPPDPRLVEAQIRSLGIQDSAIQQTLGLAERFAPMQEEQLRFGLASARTAFDQSQEDREFALSRRALLSGLQDRQASDAAAFNTEDRREQLAGEAVGDVRSAFGQARDSQMRGLQRAGVNPNDGRFAAMSTQFSAQEALAQATAANKVRAAARQEGYALTDRAANTLAGYPSMGAALTGAAAGFGAAGLGLANAGFAGQNAGFASAGAGATAMGSNATGMFNAQANYKNSQDQIAAANDPFSTILGAAAGVGTSYALRASDRRLKVDVKRVGTLDNGLPVYTYRYGAGGAYHMGVMADEVERLQPQAYVKGGAGGGYDAVDYSKLQGN